MKQELIMTDYIHIRFPLHGTRYEIYLILTFIKNCYYPSQLKHVFRLEQNVSRAMVQNSLTP